jgi:hypothetical protein
MADVSDPANTGMLLGTGLSAAVRPSIGALESTGPSPLRIVDFYLKGISKITVPLNSVLETCMKGILGGQSGFLVMVR